MNFKDKIKILIMTVMLFFSSCKNEKQNKRVFRDNPNVFLIELNNGDTEMIRKNYDDDLIFDKWNAYNFVSSELLRMEDADYKVSKSRIVNLDKFISTLSETTPNWLKTNEVAINIIAIEKEYGILIDEIGASTKQVRENCRALHREFQELRENITEIIEDYS
tara:strand:+ start:5707 stop:6195 length:489 start_codon:yes stop_codon:yes gene_type:complete